MSPRASTASPVMAPEVCNTGAVVHGGAEASPCAEHCNTLPVLPLLQTISKSPKASNASPPEEVHALVIWTGVGKGEALVPAARIRLPNLYTPPALFTTPHPP